MIFLDNFFFEKIRLIFDIQNWLWKYHFCTFWQTLSARRNFLKIFPWLHVDSWPIRLLFRTHHLWNSTTELILLFTTKKTKNKGKIRGKNLSGKNAYFPIFEQKNFFFEQNGKDHEHCVLRALKTSRSCSRRQTYVFQSEIV